MIIEGIPLPGWAKRLGKPKNLVAIGLGFLLVFYVVPIFVLFFQSLNFGAGGLLENYRTALSGIYITILLRSFYYGILTTGATLVLGYILAYYISFRGTRKNLLLGLVVLPLWVAYIIRYLGLQLFFFPTGPFVAVFGTDFGLLFSTAGVVLGLMVVFLPFAILPIYHALQSIDRDLVSASRVLGAGQLRTIRSVVIPLSLSRSSVDRGTR